MLLKTQEYLGDGLYASFDGCQIELSAPPNNVVYLEASVLENFLKYVGKLKGVGDE